LLPHKNIPKFIDGKFNYSAHEAIVHHISALQKPSAADSSLVIDVGCSKGDFMKVLRDTNNSLFRVSYTIGLDLFLPSLFLAKDVYDDVIQCDIRFLPLRESPCDIVMASEVLEHLTKNDGLMLIKDLDRISKAIVAITTPVGYNSKAHLEDDNPWQVHKSGWIPVELSVLGFDVYGIGGARVFRGERGEFQTKTRLFVPVFRLLSFISHLIMRKFVTGSFQMLCIKRSLK
jgi:hypothetical protein